jgi:hypothetical protein
VGPKLLARQARVCALAAEAMMLAAPAWAVLAANMATPTRRIWCANSAS